MKLFFSLVLLAFAAVSPAFSQGHSAGTPKTRRPNVLLITVDTLRADHVGCYGYKRIQTPALDSLAADGILYEDAFAQVPLTWPSHTAIMTGTYPFRNGVQDFTGQPLRPEFRTIAQALAANGYATGAVVSSFVLDRSWGLNRGFQFYDDAFAAPQFEQRDLGLVQRSAGESVDHALAWLKKTSAGSRPFFLWLHLYDPHSPYHPPEPYLSQYNGRPYDGEIAYADSQLARMFAWLRANHLYERTLIIFVSDHGESLGEHGENEHGFFVYAATTRVPLILKLPGEKPMSSGSREPAVQETIDIAPSILALTGVSDSITKQLQGKKLSGLPGTSGGNERTAYSETFYPFSSFGWSPLRSLVTRKYQYIEAPQPELYDLAADPQEKNNLMAGPQLPALAEEMKRALDQVIARNGVSSSQSGENGGMNPETAEKLRALGYVAYRSPVSSEALAAGLSDPKSKVAEFNAILQAEDAFHAGQFEQGVALLKQVDTTDPNMYLIPFMLGEAALRSQQWKEAQTELQRALQLNPRFDQAMTALARAEFQLGNRNEARRWLRESLKQNPQNYRAWYELGVIEEASDPAGGASNYEKALAIQPSFGPGRRDLGMLQYSQQQYEAAAKNLSQAAALGVRDARVFNALGICYRQLGQLGKAAESYRQAIALDSNLAEAHLNLALAYQLLHQESAAQAEYQAACALNMKYCRK